MNRWNELIVLDAGTNSGKLKVDSMIFGWAWSWSWLVSSGDPKICYILRMNL